MFSCQCSCHGAPALIFACSGAADVGALADTTARALARHGKGRMYCLQELGFEKGQSPVTEENVARVMAVAMARLGC